MKCKMNLEERRKLLDSANGKYFSVEFVKADGSIREMVAKKWEEQAFTYGSRNAKANTCAHKPNIYTACDSQLHQFRNISLDKLVKAKVNGKLYEFEGE